MFCPLLHSFTETFPMKEARAKFASAVFNSNIYVYGGIGTNGNFVSYAEFLDTTTQVWTTLYNSCDYFAPNTFTPNNDGLNDGWSIVTDGECWLEWKVQIFDRWGRLIWESNIPGEVWEGSNSNGNYYVADGIYVYTISGVGYNTSHTFQTSGYITIFR